MLTNSDHKPILLVPFELQQLGSSVILVQSLINVSPELAILDECCDLIFELEALLNIMPMTTMVAIIFPCISFVR